MRRLLSLVFIIFIVTVDSYSQSSSINGVIADSIEKKNVSNSVIALMRRSDSVLVHFTRADATGRFSFPAIPQGRFIIMVTHPLFGDYYDTLSVPASGNIDLGKLFMTPKSKLLAEVILKSGAPIRIKGDTTVYTADSFKVREGANVEELLRRLPGIQVDRNGQITAMGEVVKKVLVDGEEFFGSDPGIATKNLRADIVKEVEVYDKKSDQAAFTGIDDGVKDKTINLKLKDDKKRGYFGKVEAGGGLKDKYNTDIMMNAFKGKRKLAAYGIMSNTGQTNLDWKDSQNYGGGGDGFQMNGDDGGGMMFFGGNNEDNYSDGKRGIPSNWNGGLHYSNKFDKDRESVNAGYKYSKVNAPGTALTFSKTFLPDTSWSTNTRSNSFSSVVKHAVNVTIESMLDSMNSLKITLKGNKNDTRTSNSFYSESFTDAGDSINTSNRNSSAITDNKSADATVLWRHKFKKVSRTLSVNSVLNWYRSNNDGFLFSKNRYFLNGAFDHSDTTDQQNTGMNEGKSISTKIAYTEPLRKDLYMELSYSLAYNGNSNERITMIPGFNGKYTELVDSLSNSFVFNRFVNTPGLNFRLNKKKYNLSLGSAVGFSHFIQKNISANQNTAYNYTNYFPRASFVYKLKPNENFRINYNGSTNAPSLEQLQPTTINTDPLNLFIGNPNLRQSFRHSFNMGYGVYNVLKERNIWTNLQFNITQHAFSQSNTIDGLGRRVYQTVNVNGVYNLAFFGQYGFKVKETPWRISVQPVINLNRNVDYINGVRDVANNNNYTLGFNLGQYKKDKYEFNFGPNFSWNHSKASVNTSSNIDYWQVTGWANATINLPHGFDLNTDLNVQLRQKDPRFPANNNYTTWNMTAIKRFFKDQFDASFGVFDILNQNKGYQRDFNSYSYTESYYTTLKRFWMLTLTWNISKNGKPASMF